MKDASPPAARLAHRRTMVVRGHRRRHDYYASSDTICRWILERRDAERDRDAGGHVSRHSRGDDAYFEATRASPLSLWRYQPDGRAHFER